MEYYLRPMTMTHIFPTRNRPSIRQFIKKSVNTRNLQTQSIIQYWTIHAHVSAHSTNTCIHIHVPRPNYKEYSINCHNSQHERELLFRTLVT